MVKYWLLPCKIIWIILKIHFLLRSLNEIELYCFSFFWSQQIIKLVIKLLRNKPFGKNMSLPNTLQCEDILIPVAVWINEWLRKLIFGEETCLNSYHYLIHYEVVKYPFQFQFNLTNPFWIINFSKIFYWSYKLQLELICHYF